MKARAKPAQGRLSARRSPAQIVRDQQLIERSSVGSGVVVGQTNDTALARKTLDQDAQALRAEAVLAAPLMNTFAALRFAEYGKSCDPGAAYAVTVEKAIAVNNGDLSDLEAILTSQVQVLNAMFCELARRGAEHLGKDIETADTYLRTALKAQSQSRAVIETIAEMKNPSVVFARQANFANGPQQINNGNGVAARTKKQKGQQSKLLAPRDG